MDNSLSKVNHIRHLATKSVDDKNVNLIKKQNNNDNNDDHRFNTEEHHKQQHKF